MDLYASANQYLWDHPGFNSDAGVVPSSDEINASMQALVQAARHSVMRANGQLRYLEAVVDSIRKVAPNSADQFGKQIVHNDQYQDFVKTLEIGMAVLDAQSPETWEHVKKHTALTMLYYERQCNAEGRQPDTTEAMTLLLGALGHDIGKAGLDPKLLHKPVRVDPAHLETAIRNYTIKVPYYQEKLHDILFMRDSNDGNIRFAEWEKYNHVAPTLIRRADSRQAETAFTDELEMAQHNAIWNRIQTQAETYVTSQSKSYPEDWLTSEEQEALTIASRGTLTPLEKKVIATHDPMSEAFFKAAPIPEYLKAVANIVSMDGYRQQGAQAPQPVNAEEKKLADIIHATDVYEALTANRSYRLGFNMDQAMSVMEDMAKPKREGEEPYLSPEIFHKLKENRTLEAYTFGNGQLSVSSVIIDPRRYTPIANTLDMNTTDAAFRNALEASKKDGSGKNQENPTPKGSGLTSSR